MYTDRERWEKRRYKIEREGGMENKQYKQRWENKQYIIEREGGGRTGDVEREKERTGDMKRDLERK